LGQVASVQEAFEAAKLHLLEITNPEDVDATDPISKVSGSGVPSEVAAFTTAYDALSIVNPDKTKFATTVLNETYYELIRRFANELEKENSVLFVHGFSFRDEHLRDLVLRAARTNPTLQVVIFCYSRADRTAYAKLLPEGEVKNGNILYVQPAELEDHSGERSISLDTLEADFFAPVIADRVPQPDQRIELDIRTDAGDANGP
jgi:hypothetical protein